MNTAPQDSMNTNPPITSDTCAPATGSTLAERLFAARADEDSLFEKVNGILGCNVHECLQEGFSWAAKDTYWDDYDCSVEVVMNPEWPPMTDAQAIEILALGFCQIYCSQGEVMTHFGHRYSAPGALIPGSINRWTAGTTHTREGGEDNQWRAKCNVLSARLASLTERSNASTEG